MKKFLILLIIMLLLLGGVFLFMPEKKQEFFPQEHTPHNQSSQPSFKKKFGNFFAPYHTFSVAKNSEKKVIILWKDNQGNQLNSLKNVKNFLEKDQKKVLYLSNAGMYNEDRSSTGLFIEKRKIQKKINTVKNAYGNFHIQPNGVFFITPHQEYRVETTENFLDFEKKFPEKIEYATQSGPMLVVNGAINPLFKKNSEHINIRNGLCITKEETLFFAISNFPVSLYHFAEFFQKKNCVNALYLDGYVSRAYIPSQNRENLDGNFGPIIAVVKE